MISPVRIAPTSPLDRFEPAFETPPPSEPVDQFEASDDFVEGELLVKLRPNIFQSQQEAFAEHYGARLAERFNFPQELFQSFAGDLIRLELPPGMSVGEAMAAMQEDERVDYVATNDVYTLDEFAPDDLDPRLYALRNTGQEGGKPGADIDAMTAWEKSIGTREENAPIIAVIDTGVDYTHPDLINNIWRNPNEVADGQDTDGNGVVDDLFGYNAYADSGDPMDGHSHGTHVAGTIAAEGNNGEGVVGVNWQARLMPIKIFNDSGRTSAAAILRGIAYATRHGARITSNSWGGGRANKAIREAFRDSPALHIMAAGNDSSDNDRRPHYPSNYNLANSIAVASTDRRDQLSSFSNYGETTVDIAAPGSNIYSTMPGGGYAYKSGTSMATPQVSGVAGLVAATFPELSNEQIKARLLRGADPVENLRGKVAVGGRLNAANSLDSDGLPPATVTDLRVREVGSTRLKLDFTATGDDGWCGKAQRYDLRMASQPITDLNAFEQAQSVAAPTPSEPHSLEQVAISVTPSGEARTLYFGLRVADNVGNTSGLATASAEVPAAQIAFSEGFEGEETGWSSDGPWARVEVPGRGRVYTDSPNGDYDNDANHSLTSPRISLQGLRGSTLLFDARYNLESGYDTVTVEATADEQNWTPLKRFTGRQGWQPQQLDLSQFDGGEVRLRFRLQSDQSVSADGFSIDNLSIVGDRSGASAL